MSKPIQRQTPCPHCGVEAQELHSEPYAIFWCAAGHVTTSRDGGQSYAIVDNMTQPKPLHGDGQ